MTIPAVVWTILIPVLKLLLALLSKPLKSLMETKIKELHAEALSTDNPADDVFTEFLAALLSVSLDGVAPSKVNEFATVASPELKAQIVQAITEYQLPDNAFDSVVPEDLKPEEEEKG